MIYSNVTEATGIDRGESGLDLNMNYLSNLWLVLNSVGSLLKLSDLSYDMRYLQTEHHDLSVYRPFHKM